MAFRRWTGSAWTEPTSHLRRWSGSAWIDVDTVKRWTGSAWETVYTAAVASVLALTNRLISHVAANTTVTVGIQTLHGGSLRERKQTSYTAISGQWATEAVTGNLYEVYAEIDGANSGVSSATGTLNSWLSLDTSREWTISRGFSGLASRDIRLTIREKANTSNSVTAVFQLRAEYVTLQ